MYTRKQWSVALLKAIGNSNPDNKITEWVVAWTSIETTHPPGAAYNLLNTTEPNTPGVVSDFNSVGVKNYDTFAHGIQANAKVLQNGRYNLLETWLRNGHPGLYTVNATIDAELSTWGTGTVQNVILERLGQHMQDEFPGNAPTPPVSPPPPANTWPELALAEFQASVKVPNNTGIAQSWMIANQHGIDYGPALGPEFRQGDFSYQWFAYAYCKWSHVSHTPEWFNK